MIKYDRLWVYMREHKVSQYRIIHSGISNSTLQRLKKNEPVSTETISKLCRILKCRVEDIMEYIEIE